MMLTSFPTYSLYQLSYTCNFLNCITLPFRILFSQFIYCYSIAYSVRRVGFHSYNLLSALLPTSIRIFLNAGSFFANLPAVSGVSLTLARKILYRVMASVESDYTAHVIFKVQKESFLNILSLATVYKGNIIKNLIMDCQSYTKYRPNETTGGIFVSWRRKEELPTGA